MIRRKLVPGALLAIATCTAALAQTTGLVPLDDLGAGTYQGFQGGLYPGGVNTPPAAHQTAALNLAAQIVPRNAAGNPDPQGLIVMIAIGMSNTTHEFGAFERNEDANPARNARVVLMDTAFGGQTASAIAPPSAPYWTTMQQRLAAMGLAAAQVQVAWLKEAEANPPDDFPLHAQALRDNLELIANDLHDKFPNLRLCYVSSRIYGGYTSGSLNPEPQAYESGFSAKWLIEDQINGDTGLSYGQLPGPVRSPLLLWGPYLWADGTTPRSDGLIWVRGDLENDGVHPAPPGEQKVAALLSSFFAGEPTAAAWWPARPDAVLDTIAATKDAYVRSAAPSVNYGNQPLLLGQGGAAPVRTFLGFDVGAAPRPVALAKLSLRVDAAGGGSVVLVDDTTWGESTLTWGNSPPLGAVLVNMPQSSRDGTIGANVTASVNADADGLLSFALSTTAAGSMSYHSKEAAAPPRLVLTIPCPGPNTDGDARADSCDCAPLDGAAFAVPPEVGGFRWLSRTRLGWSAVGPMAGSGTVYDVMSGDLATVSFFGTSGTDSCLVDGSAGTELDDPTGAPAAGNGRFLLVRGDNACGPGRYETSSAGLDRQTTACP